MEGPFLTGRGYRHKLPRTTSYPGISFESYTKLIQNHRGPVHHVNSEKQKRVGKRLRTDSLSNYNQGSRDSGSDFSHDIETSGLDQKRYHNPNLVSECHTSQDYQVGWSSGEEYFCGEEYSCGISHQSKTTDTFMRPV